MGDVDSLSKRLKALRAGAATPASSSRDEHPSLVVEPKERPQLVVKGDAAEYSSQLASELADALGDDEPVREQSSSAEDASLSALAKHQPQAVAQYETDDVTRDGDDIEDDEKVNALMARFSALRDSNTAATQEHPQTDHDKSAAARSDHDNRGKMDDIESRLAALRGGKAATCKTPSTNGASLNHDDPPPQSSSSIALSSLDLLPSVPTALPPARPAHPTLGSDHADIPSDTDLSPFRRLASGELDVRNLALGETKTAPDVADTDSDSDDDPSTWCTICTSPATLACFSPQDEDEGCAGDLYCSQCWVEGHQGMQRDELREHRTREVANRKRRGRRTGGGGGGGGTPRKAMPA